MFRAGTGEQLTKADERRRPNKAAAADGKIAAAVLSVERKKQREKALTGKLGII